MAQDKVYQYLQEVRAIGKEHAVSMRAVMVALNFHDTRAVRKAVAWERNNGKRLICSTYSGGGGYYLPANDAEIYEMKKRLERGFVSRANAVRVFRHAVKEIEQRKAKQDGEKE